MWKVWHPETGRVNLCRSARVPVPEPLGSEKGAIDGNFGGRFDAMKATFAGEEMAELLRTTGSAPKPVVERLIRICEIGREARTSKS